MIDVLTSFVEPVVTTLRKRPRYHYVSKDQEDERERLSCEYKAIHPTPRFNCSRCLALCNHRRWDPVILCYRHGLPLKMSEEEVTDE